jgi:riboflavin biosynthesis pyrimidine reductase
MTHDRGAGASLETLWSGPETTPSGSTRGRPMPDELRARYGGPIEIPVRPDRPTVLVNFVSSLDGIAALGPGDQQGGGVISGFFEPDRFVMSVLRSVADVILMGAGTIAGSSSTDWTPEHLQPALAPAIERWRGDLGLAPHPTTVIVTTGDIRLGRRGVDDPDLPIVFLTTAAGADELRRREFPAHVAIEVAGSGERVSAVAIRSFLDRYRGQLVLCEGGPHLLGDLVETDAVDELFLTVSPQVLGRDEGRLGLVEGVALPADQARWQELVSIKRAGDHVFLRYRRRR